MRKIVPASDCVQGSCNGFTGVHVFIYGCQLIIDSNDTRTS